MKSTGFVKILPDIYLPEPLKHMNMGSMNRFRDNTSMQQSYRRFQAATTPWPVHVYETHNMTTIIEKARTQLAQHKIDTMPSDPTQLSYWLVRNLHLPEKMLQSVFLANTVNTRLQLIASTFKEVVFRYIFFAQYDLNYYLCVCRNPCLYVEAVAHILLIVVNFLPCRNTVYNLNTAILVKTIVY